MAETICFDSQISWIMNGYFHDSKYYTYVRFLFVHYCMVVQIYCWHLPLKLPKISLKYQVIAWFLEISFITTFMFPPVILRFNLKIVLLCILVFTLLFEYNYTRIHENKTYLPVSDVFLVLLCEYITSTVSWSFFYVAKNRVKQIKVLVLICSIN